LYKFDKTKRSCAAVSSVMGEVLLTGIFVIFFGSLCVSLCSFDAPQSTHHISAEEWVDASSDTIYLRHGGGEPIDAENLKILVEVNGDSYEYSPGDISENLGKNLWELADVIEINANEEWGVGIPYEGAVDVKLIDTGSKVVIPKYRVSFPSEFVEFDIEGGAVIPKDSFISGFEVLGAAIQSGETHLMVTTRIKIGSDTFDPWGAYDQPVTSNVNTDVNGSNLTFFWEPPSSYPADTPITISGKSWNNQYSVSREVNSESGSPLVKVLRNGDEVPDITGFMDQDSIADFVKDYVGDDKIVLEENEAIFLFELGVDEANLFDWNGDYVDAADFQDLVILVSVNPAS
jgi:FlaG/FlaF family flagellin (archaellin)